MENLITSTEAAKMLGMSKQAFYSSVKSGRFTVAGRNKHGHPLFAPSVVKKEHAATRETAQLQNHARKLPPALQGGRPPKKDDTHIGNANNTKDSVNVSSKLQDGFLKVKLKNEITESKRKEIKLKVESGQYIDKEDAMKQGIEVGQLIMGVLEAFPSRLAPELAAMKGADLHDFQQILEREVNELIISIHKRITDEP